MKDAYQTETHRPGREEIASSLDLTKGPTPKDFRVKRFTLRRFALSCLASLIILIAAGFAIQSVIRPEVDPNLKAPVAVTSTVTSDDPLADLPLHAITRSITQEMIDQAEHPLIPVLEVAKKGVEYMDQNVTDYETVIVSQARVNNVLGEERYLRCKVRHQSKVDGKFVPFSVYTRFLKPQSIAGQEAIWIKGRNRGKIIAHGNGLLNVKRIYLNPDGAVAMRGNRYSMPNLGMKNLIKKMIEKADNDLARGECLVTITRGVKLDDHPCTMLEIKHPKPRKYFDFHIARIYIDDERNLAIAYEGFMWPEKPGDPPPLLERYYYTDIRLNNGFTKLDFSPANGEYDYPIW